MRTNRTCSLGNSGPACPACAGFTKLDLLVLVAVAGLLLGWLVFAHTGERGRTARCARNLVVLGQGMLAFAADHNGGLPPASVAVGPLDVSWSFLVAPYVRPELAASNPRAAKWQYEDAIADRLVCPSDRVLRGYPRSYAMPAYEMRPENWPPSGKENCGVGLAWNGDAIKRLLKKETVTAEGLNMTDLALVKLSQIPDPANTLLLTELVQEGHKRKSSSRATVNGPGEQVEGVSKQGGSLHTGRFNYLMVDGHVECLRPYQVETFSSSAGIWTIKKGD